MTGEDGGRDWRGPSTNQGTSEIVSKPPGAGRQETDSPSEPTEGTNLAGILALAFWPVEL